MVDTDEDVAGVYIDDIVMVQADFVDKDGKSVAVSKEERQAYDWTTDQPVSPYHVGYSVAFLTHSGSDVDVWYHCTETGDRKVAIEVGCALYLAIKDFRRPR